MSETISIISIKCQKCPFTKACDHKQMEMMACSTIGTAIDTAFASHVLVSASAIAPYVTEAKKSIISMIELEIEQGLNYEKVGKSW